jgi:hypothetical protein
VTAAARTAIALSVCALACAGKRPASGVDAAAEHVELSRSTHTLAPEPYGSAPPSPDAAVRNDSGAAVTSTADDDNSGTADPAGDGDSLVGEERERDPRSDTVKIKVIVDARRQAHVTWGRKDFGVAPLEIERPRNSGPLDLIVVAPGYLPLHARALTDRDDVLNLRLYSAAEAPELLGYRQEELERDSGSPGSPNSLQNKGEKRTETKPTSATHGDSRTATSADKRGGRSKTGDEKSWTTTPTTKKQGK